MAVKTGSLDKQLLKLAGQKLSPVEISEALEGRIAPEAVVSRLKSLLSQKNYFSIAEMQQMQLMSLYEDRDFYREIAESGDRNAEKAFGSLARTQVSIGQLLQNMEKSNLDEKLMQVHELHARVMAQAILVAFEKAALKLADRFDVPVEAAQEIMLEVLPLAKEYLDETVEENE